VFLQTSDPSGPVVHTELTFRAPRRMVWRTFTEPELLKKWHFAMPGWETFAAEVALTPLGEYRLGIRPKDRSWESWIHGHYIDVRAEELLTYTFTGAAESADYWTLVTVRFEDRDGGSALSLTHGVFRNDEDRILHEQGWLGCFQQLGVLLGEPMEVG
jgi:uncharacterized protein YndB with AHSA1/START domain